jgi:hypothetical protein
MPSVPYPEPITVRPSWLPLVDAGKGAPASTAGLPGEGWPAIETLDYTTKLITLIVLLLALPWLLGKVFTHPEQVSRAAAGMR